MWLEGRWELEKLAKLEAVKVKHYNKEKFHFNLCTNGGRTGGTSGGGGML